MTSSLSELQKQVGEINTANGWREPMNPYVAELLAMQALIVTEVAEAIEEIRAGFTPEHVYYRGKLPEGREVVMGPEAANDPEELEELGLKRKELKPEGVPSELADIVIRCLDFADKHDIDLQAAVVEKLKYNAQRGYRHGGKAI